MRLKKNSKKALKVKENTNFVILFFMQVLYELTNH